MLKNITNGEFKLDYQAEDFIASENRLIRLPPCDLAQENRTDSTAKPTYFIENIRSGSFSEISESYMLESSQLKQTQQLFTTNFFDVEMRMIVGNFKGALKKVITLFQGLYAGMSLLFTITLTLSTSVSADLVRVEDQAIRIVSLLSAFGSLYSLLIAYQRYGRMKTEGTSVKVEASYKNLWLSFIEMIAYIWSYVIFLASHRYAVQYNILGTDYVQLTQLTIAYTIIGLMGWLFTNANTYKYP